MVSVFSFLIFSGCFLASLVLGALLFKRLSTWNLLDRFIAASTPVALLILSLSTLSQYLKPFPRWQEWVDWHGARLVPTFALIHDHQLYYNPDSGPIIGMIYGPIMAIAYLPATIANSPVPAIALALLISAAFYFLPVLWLDIGENWRSPQKLLFALSTFVGFCFFTFNSSALSRGSALAVHADAPALGLSATACAVLYYRKRKDSIPALLLSATLAVLAVWTKQVTIPLPFALLSYIWLVDGRRCFQRYVLCLCFSGAVISILLLGIFNPQPLVFNMFINPSHQPWWMLDTGQVLADSGDIKNGIRNLLLALRELIQQCFLPGVIVTFYFLHQWLFSSNQPEKLATWLSHNRWTMLVIVSLFMIPTSMLGRVKVGGADNAFSYTVYFLAAAATLVIIKSASDSQSLNEKLLGQAVKLLVAIGLVGVLILNIPSLGLIALRLQRLPSNPQQVAYQYAKKHPGEAYFPWNPLSSLMAEGKLYHFEYGLVDRDLAGFPVSNDHFRAHIPPNIQLIAFSERNDNYVMRFLPEFSRRIKVDELPGFTVYTRG